MSVVPKLTCIRKHNIDYNWSAEASPGVMVVLGVVFIFLMAPEILAIALSPVISSVTGYSENHSSWIVRLLVFTFAIYLCVCLISRLSCFRDLPGGLSISSSKVFAISVVAAFLIFLLLKYYQAHLSHNDVLALQKNVTKFKVDLRSMPLLVLFVSLIVVNVLIPIFEEMLFRGVLLNYFSRRFNLIVGISINSIVFMVIHRSHLPVVLSFGVVASILALKSRGLLAPIIMHVIYNSAVTIDAAR
ncbi:MAG: hypothetical protein COW59_02540 [Lysobacterales bacterium CG17_big_fil_post_rev_8_21_14_2_50_64_11]|nr:MAG: hypothetical protein COW59_02540 [Xanthomonadales bacterium CG17_big_fil_post_rev_8_21_14_2_50_64_11]PIX59914.1 MAG: hypothetical protein COZ47_09935 [Xanthomonadales bacterium CG_4_10_14_3_um_filter_64_11]